MSSNLTPFANCDVIQGVLALEPRKYPLNALPLTIPAFDLPYGHLGPLIPEPEPRPSQEHSDLANRPPVSARHELCPFYTTTNCPIMPASSCSKIWQWNM